jgi:cyclophilin family peptidyl-prolyl cis-trans isomerase
MIACRLFLFALGLVLVNPVLRDPSHPAFKEKAPEHFRVHFETTKGDMVIACHRDWAPIGVDRFYHLVEHGYYDDACFFRVIEGAWAQFGIHGEPEIARIWRNAAIPDEPVRESNLRGRLTYAHGFDPDDRTTQLFINLRDNPALDDNAFSPIGEIIEGMEVADALYADYAAEPGGGIRGGGQDPMFEGGNAYFRERFPKLDFIVDATILPTKCVEK